MFALAKDTRTLVIHMLRNPKLSIQSISQKAVNSGILGNPANKGKSDTEKMLKVLSSNMKVNLYLL